MAILIIFGIVTGINFSQSIAIDHIDLPDLPTCERIKKEISKGQKNLNCICVDLFPEVDD